MAVTQCPKCGYVRRPEDGHVNAMVCPACGIAYGKWLERPKAGGHPPQRNNIQHEEPSLFEFITETTGPVDVAAFYGRMLTWLALFVWGWSFILAGIDWTVIGASFMHHINLPFHEFGHVLFMPFGRFMHILGGSLFQVLLPLGLMLAFIIQRRDNFAASVMLWWAGQSLIDVSPYIADARDRAIPLVGGADEEFHDWGNLLTMMDALDKTRTVAKFSFGLGALLMLLSFAWGAYVLYRQKKNTAQTPYI